MLDEVELRIARALRADADGLPIAIVPSMVEERLNRSATAGFSLPWVTGTVAAGLVLFLTAAVWFGGPATRSPGAAPAGSAPGTSNPAEACAVTRPDPPFAAPSPYPASAPDDDAAWYGSPQLWTMLALEGAVWELPQLVEKTWWWSAAWDSGREPEPPITVSGTRLDGPGTFTAGPGTNATSPDLGGEAMLVGVEFPSAGCWQVTAEYREATLSIVVLIVNE